MKNPHAQELGKLSAKARAKIHDKKYYQELGRKSAEARRKKNLDEDSKPVL